MGYWYSRDGSTFGYQVTPHIFVLWTDFNKEYLDTLLQVKAIDNLDYFKAIFDLENRGKLK